MSKEIEKCSLVKDCYHCDGNKDCEMYSQFKAKSWSSPRGTYEYKKKEYEGEMTPRSFPRFTREIKRPEIKTESQVEIEQKEIK